MMLTSLGCFVQLEPPSPQYNVEWQYLFQILPPHPRASISTLYWGEGGPKVGVGSGVAPYTCFSTGRIRSINRRSMSSFLFRGSATIVNCCQWGGGRGGAGGMWGREKGGLAFSRPASLMPASSKASLRKQPLRGHTTAEPSKHQVLKAF